ncbi:hypothetical protein V8C86DRAFT_2966362, partial [Haematococcus lacustris]
MESDLFDPLPGSQQQEEEEEADEEEEEEEGTTGNRGVRWTDGQDKLFAELIVKTHSACAGKINFAMGTLLAAEVQEHSVALGRMMTEKQALYRMDYIKRGCQAVYKWGSRRTGGGEPEAFFKLQQKDQLLILKGGAKKGRLNKMNPTQEVFSTMLPILIVDTANNPQFTLAAGVRKVKRSQGQVVDLTADEELSEDSRQQAEEQRRGRHAIWGDVRMHVESQGLTVF